MKSIIALIGILLCQLRALPQALAGDKINHWVVSNVHPGQGTLNLDSLKGKFIVLDFFSSSCVVCFKSLPKINELQEKYKQKLKIILIGKDDARIRTVYNKYAERFQLHLTVAFDSMLFAKQQIESVPYYLWIDDENTVQGVTGPEQLTEINIDEFLNKRYTALNPGKQQKIPFDETKPILVRGNGAPDSQFLYRSVLLNWNSSMETCFPPSIDYALSPFTFQAMGVTIQSLYNYAYIGADGWRPGHQLYGSYNDKPLLEMGDSSLLKQLFSYSLSLPSYKFQKEQIQNQMKIDLFQFFGFSVREEIRNMPCWKLVATPEGRLRSRTKKNVKKTSGSKVSIDYEFVPVVNLIKTLQAYTFPNEILVDETGIEGYIDVKLEAILTDPEDVRKALLNRGFDLWKSEKPMKVIVLRSEKNNPAQGVQPAQDLRAFLNYISKE